MEIAVAVMGFVGVVTVAAWLLRWVFGTLVELRRITTDLSTLRWALGQVPADRPHRGSVTNGRRRPGSG
jgi:hypothetical protein